MQKKRVFSGIQPTGNLHIGNYVGAVLNWVAMQKDYENIFCIVDAHAITIKQNPAELKTSIHELAALLLACGIDPERSVLYVQSDVSEHMELAWLLNCSTPMGWLGRMTQFKDKSASQREKVSLGLFAYPVLMAADILLYDTDLVPVGEDQTQHLEFCRDLAQRFNNLYGETFQLPETIVPKVGARVMGLDDPTKKMSKSEVGQNHAIHLLDEPAQIRKKIARAQTDSQTDIVFDEKRPGIYNLLSLYEVFSGLGRKEIEDRFQGKGYGDFKKDLGDLVASALEPIQVRYKELIGDPARIDGLLRAGADKARPLAQTVLKRVKDQLGLGA